MSVLDQVMDLRSRGIADREIFRRLQEEGISPGEINDAFSKAQIKSAVSYSGMEAGMQPSILGSEEEPERLPLEGLEGGTLSDEDLTPPVPGGFQGQMMPRHVTQEVSNGYNQDQAYTPEETYSPQPQYSQFPPPQEGYEYVPSVGSDSTDTMIEVAEQVFSEKNKPIQKKIEEVNEFKVLSQTKIENISDRLRRIENIIDRLQASILEKIGSYGQGLETVRKEMGMMQESFGKVVNQVADAGEARHHAAHHQIETHPQHSEHHITVHKSRKTTRKSSKR